MSSRAGSTPADSSGPPPCLIGLRPRARVASDQQQNARPGPGPGFCRSLSHASRAGPSHTAPLSHASTCTKSITYPPSGGFCPSHQPDPGHATFANPETTHRHSSTTSVTPREHLASKWFIVFWWGRGPPNVRSRPSPKTLRVIFPARVSDALTCSYVRPPKARMSHMPSTNTNTNAGTPGRGQVRDCARH